MLNEILPGAFTDDNLSCMLVFGFLYNSLKSGLIESMPLPPNKLTSHRDDPFIGDLLAYGE